MYLHRASVLFAGGYAWFKRPANRPKPSNGRFKSKYCLKLTVRYITHCVKLLIIRVRLLNADCFNAMHVCGGNTHRQQLYNRHVRGARQWSESFSCRNTVLGLCTVRQLPRESLDGTLITFYRLYASVIRSLRTCLEFAYFSQ